MKKNLMVLSAAALLLVADSTVLNARKKKSEARVQAIASMTLEEQVNQLACRVTELEKEVKQLKKKHTKKAAKPKKKKKKKAAVAAKKKRKKKKEKACP